MIIVVLALSTVTACMVMWGAWLHEDHPTYLTLPAMLANVIGLAVAYIPGTVLSVNVAATGSVSSMG